MQVLSTLFVVVVTAAEVLHAINRMSDVQKNPTIAPFLNELTMFKHSIDGFDWLQMCISPTRAKFKGLNHTLFLVDKFTNKIRMVHLVALSPYNKIVSRSALEEVTMLQHSSTLEDGSALGVCDFALASLLQLELFQIHFPML